jgi:NurA-like 5'-3' nuclease
MKDKIREKFKILDRYDYPRLYRWAKKNPDTLVNMVEAMARNYKNPEESIGMAMAVLESDLR